MKIKMKVKHLIYWLCGIALFFAAFHWIILPQTGLYLAKKHADKDKADAKTKILESLHSDKILDTQKWHLIETHMISGDYLNEQFPATISPGMSGVNETDGQVNFTWKEKLPFIQKYLAKGPISDIGFPSAAKQLARYYAGNNQLQKANRTLQQAINRAKKADASYLTDEINIERVQITMDHDDGNYHDTKKLLQHLRSNREDDDYYFLGMLDTLDIKLTLQQDNVKKAYQQAKRALDNYEKRQLKQSQQESDIDEADNNIEDTDVHGNLLTLRHQLERALQTGSSVSTTTVKGHLTRSDGKPVANALIALRPGVQNTSTISSDEPYLQLTDADGSYAFKGVLPDSYQMTIGLTLEQVDGWTWPVDMDDWIDVDGKDSMQYDITMHPLINIHSPANEQKITGKTVHFAWDKVPGAAYYEVDVGDDTVSTPFKPHVTDNEIAVPIEELYNQPIGWTYVDDDSEFAQAKSLLAFTHTNNRFNWYVEAYDDSGNKIAQSDGFRLDKQDTGNVPFFYLQARKMSQADKLLIKKKPKAALAAYLKNAANNPDDLQSLRMIVRLTESRVMENPSEKAEQQQFPFAKALAEKTKSPGDINWLLTYYDQKRDWSSYNKWFASYQKATNGYLNGYEQSDHATALLKQGKWQQALTFFQKGVPMDKGHRYVGNWLAASLYVDSGFYQAIQIASTYPERPLGDDAPPDWSSMIQQMKKESENNTTYQQTLQHALDLYFQGKEKSLDKWLQTTEFDTMKKFITALQNVD